MFRASPVDENRTIVSPICPLLVHFRDYPWPFFCNDWMSVCTRRDLPSPASPITQDDLTHSLLRLFPPIFRRLNSVSLPVSGVCQGCEVRPWSVAGFDLGHWFSSASLEKFIAFIRNNTIRRDDNRGPVEVNIAKELAHTKMTATQQGSSPPIEPDRRAPTVRRGIRPPAQVKVADAGR